MDPRIVAEKITEEAASNQSDSEPNSKAESEVKDCTIEILKTDPTVSALGKIKSMYVHIFVFAWFFENRIENAKS